MLVGDNYIIFKTSVLFEDKVKIQNRELFFDPGFEPQRHVRIYGEVVQIPVRLTKIPIMQIPRGTPPYHDEAPYRYKWVSDIQPEVKVGDLIYFHFNTIMRLGQNIVKEITQPGTSKVIEWWFKVRYDSVLCAVRNGQIIPIGSYALVEPDMESIEDILVPIAMTGADGKAILGPDNRPILKPKDQWLQVKPGPSHKPLRGWIRHIGSPLIGDVRKNYVGQMIYYRPNADWQNNIEGVNYFTIRQGHILGGEDIS